MRADDATLTLQAAAFANLLLDSVCPTRDATGVRVDLNGAPWPLPDPLAAEALAVLPEHVLDALATAYPAASPGAKQHLAAALNRHAHGVAHGLDADDPHAPGTVAVANALAFREVLDALSHGWAVGDDRAARERVLNGVLAAYEGRDGHHDAEPSAIDYLSGEDWEDAAATLLVTGLAAELGPEAIRGRTPEQRQAQWACARANLHQPGAYAAAIRALGTLVPDLPEGQPVRPQALVPETASATSLSVPA